MFEYDAMAPLGTERVATAEIRDLTFSSPMGGRVPAYLVVPEGEGPFAGLVYVHPGQGDRRTFLPEAVAMAGAGAVSLLIDAPFLRSEFVWSPIPDAAREAAAYRQLVTDVRRGIDLLVSLPQVDAARVGYVGHSLGATWGGPLAGVEQRLRACVLMAGYASLTDWYRTSSHPFAVQARSGMTPEQTEAYLAVLEPLDAVHHIGRAKAPLLFQFSRHDEFIDPEQAERYVAAAPELKTVHWYDSDHLFTGCREAQAGRRAWLAKHLNLK